MPCSNPPLIRRAAATALPPLIAPAPCLSAGASFSGSAVTIKISLICGGVSDGLASSINAIAAVTIGAALLLSHFLGEQANLTNAAGVNVGGLFGTAVATMGMLMTTAFILAEDTFGPITDNAGGIAEFSRSEAGARQITDRLDAVGNTTKALTKGYAVASAALAAFLLFSAYLERVAQLTGRPFEAVNLAKVDVFIGGLLGAMLVYLFSSLAIRAVGRAGGAIIAWGDTRSGTTDIYAQRVDAAGTPQWTVHGVAVATGSGNQSTPRLLATTGGAWIAWHDDTTTEGKVAFLSSAGAVGAPFNLGYLASSEAGVSLVTDGAGGFIAAWLGNGQVSAVRVNSGSVIIWSATPATGARG